MNADKTPWDAFQITERKGLKPQWNRIGVAFVNKDQSINLFLDAFPKDGKVQLRMRDKTRSKNGAERKYNEYQK